MEDDAHADRTWIRAAMLSVPPSTANAVSTDHVRPPRPHEPCVRSLPGSRHWARWPNGTARASLSGLTWIWRSGTLDVCRIASIAFATT